jgi:hypothetical protein
MELPTIQRLGIFACCYGHPDYWELALYDGLLRRRLAEIERSLLPGMLCSGYAAAV